MGNIIHFNTNDERSAAFYRNACGAPGKIGDRENNTSSLDEVTCDPCKGTYAFKNANKKESNATPDPYDDSYVVWNSPKFSILNVPDTTQITIPKIPLIVITDGKNSDIFDDDFEGPVPLKLSVIKRAAYVARLRALADVLESKS